MNQLVLEIKKTAGGRILARRRDGKELTEHDRCAAKSIAAAQHPSLRANVEDEVYGCDGTLKALLMFSAVLGDHLWLEIDPYFLPIKSFASYYPEEMHFLKTKSRDQIHEIHQAKLLFPGCRIIQEGPEK